MVAMCELYRGVQDLIDKHNQENVTIILLKILNEWKNIFVILKVELLNFGCFVQVQLCSRLTIYALDIQFKSLIFLSSIFNQMCYITDVYSEKTTDMEVVILLDHLGKTMKMVDGNIIFKNHTFLTRTVGLALKFFQSTMQLGTYHILKYAVPKLVEQDQNTIKLKNFDVNTLNIKKLEEVLQSTQNIMNAILMEFK